MQCARAHSALSRSDVPHDANKLQIIVPFTVQPYQGDQVMCSVSPFRLDILFDSIRMFVCVFTVTVTVNRHSPARSRSVSENHTSTFRRHLSSKPSLCFLSRRLSVRLLSLLLLFSSFFHSLFSLSRCRCHSIACGLFLGLSNTNLHFHFLLCLMSTRSCTRCTRRRTCMYTRNWRVLQIVIWISFSIESWEFISFRGSWIYLFHYYLCISTYVYVCRYIFGGRSKKKRHKSKTSAIHTRSLTHSVGLAQCVGEFLIFADCWNCFVSVSVLSNQVHKSEQR